jgi:CRP/FNR family cyclic AMP-dependent transcriptional regulator
MKYAQISSLPLFQGLSSHELNLLAERFQYDSFLEGSIIFDQGDPADRLYVLIAGRVAIRFKPDDGEVLTVTEIEENGVFGWSSALGRSTYTSSAACLEDCQTVSVMGDELRKLWVTHPETGVIILERLAEVIAERLRNTHEHVVDMLTEGMCSENSP